MRALRAAAKAVTALLAVVLLVVVAAAGTWLLVSRGFQRERVRSFAEAALQAALADAGVRGELRVGAVGGGLYPDLELRDVTLVRDGAPVARIPSAQVSLDLRALYAERRVIVTRLRIAGARLSLAPDARGEWPWALEAASEPEHADAERPFSVELREVELANAQVDASWVQLGEPSHLAGTLSAAVRELVIPRRGAPGWPKSGSASLAVTPGMVAGRALLGAELDLALDGSHLRLGDSRLDSAFGSVRLAGETDLAGWLDPEAPASARLEGEAAALDLAVLLARPELAGTVGGKLRLDASHSAGTPLEASRAGLSLELARSRIGRLAISGGTVRGSYDAGRWQLASARLLSNAATLDASGSGDLERVTALDATLDVTDLAALAVLVSSDARGKARAKLRVTGAWRAPDGVLELETRELRVAGLDLGALKLRARGTGLDRYRIEPLTLDGPTLSAAADGPVLLRRARNGVRIERARLELGPGETLSLAGHVSTAAVRDLRVDLERVALARIGSLAGFAEPLGGRVTGSLVANGALPRPALGGKLVWNAPELGDVSAESIAVDVATSGGVLRADGRIRARGQELLAARFATPWSARADLSRALERPETLLLVTGSELRLSLAQDLLPKTLQRVDGTANVRIELHGGSPEPTLDGEVTVSNGTCEVPALAQRFGPLEAKLVLTRDSIRVERFHLAANKTGSADLTGEVKLERLRPATAKLDLGLTNFPIRWQTTLQTYAFGGVSLRGPVDGLLAQGRVQLRGLHYSLAGGTDPLLGEVRVYDSRLEPPKPRARPAESLAQWERATVDVKLEIGADGRVQGQGANLEIAGDLVAQKSPGGPLALAGAIDTQRGSYRFRGKTFVVERAHVAFTGRPDLDPDLDVRAMHRVRNIRVYALVRGRASQPRITLQSDPPYPQDDVFALLLFGKTRDELSQQQAGQLQSALAGTAGVAAIESLSDRLGFDIPVDTVEVDDSDSSGRTTVGVGGYLTEDVFVRYGGGWGADSESSVRVDWRFRKRWSIETEISTRGDSSADLVWSYDY